MSIAPAADVVYHWIEVRNMIYNPIIRGFNPDPSICFDGDYYYITTSTFEYFPACPIYRSRDLCDWEFLRFAIDDTRLLDLKGCRNSSGIYAPTIRYNDGRYYLVTTDKNGMGNFIIHTDDIAKGRWEGPFHVRHDGIDPSLFFDGGRCFYCSNGVVDGERGIIGAWVNPENGRLESDVRLLTPGLSHHATEAPHIYRRGSFFYLLFSEGGTEYGHHCVIGRSSNIDGPYELCSKPVLDHRDRKGHAIQATGHADMIKNADGRWFAVFLAIRMFGKPLLHNLGRETFMADVSWNDSGWPVIGNGGFVELEMPGIATDKEDVEKKTTLFDFSSPLSDQNRESLRIRRLENYVQDIGNRRIKLHGGCGITEERGEPTMLLTRQTEFETETSIGLETDQSLTGIGGVCVWYSNKYALILEISKRNGSVCYRIVRCVHDLVHKERRIRLKSVERLCLGIKADKSKYSILINGRTVAEASIANFCTEGCMENSFTGTMLGFFAQNGDAVFFDSESPSGHIEKTL